VTIESDRHAQTQRSKLTRFSLHQQKWIWKSTKMYMKSKSLLCQNKVML